jgi:TfoX/Sxy family transcriptional regulator of competence genes
MAYSESLADRVRQIFRGRGRTEKKMTVKKMFGGVGFLLGGNMCVGVWQTSLIVRVGPTAYKGALKEPNVREFDITGRPMAGWVLVDAEGLDDDASLRKWIDRGIEFVATLPRK